MITPDLIQSVAALIEAQGADEFDLTGLRSGFSGTHFTACSDDDVIGARPVHQGTGFNLYLVDGRGHCMQFTNDPAGATGIVVAAVTEDP